MKSPFPGMDPYLEDHWGDVHTSLAIYARNQLRGQVPPELKVRVQEYVAVEDPEIPAQSWRYVPDVRVVEDQGAADSATAVAEPEVASAGEPLLVPIYIEPPTQREILITDAKAGGRLVTAIEILSPTNKGSGHEDYREKQREFLAAGVSLVEVDLQRRGGWVVAAPQDKVREDHRGPYRICVVRAAKPHRAEMYRATYRSPLPTINIPLRRGDADAKLDLQKLIDQAYEEGDYGDTDYRKEPVPPFLPEEFAWADQLLREQGRR